MSQVDGTTRVSIFDTILSQQGQVELDGLSIQSLHKSQLALSHVLRVKLIGASTIEEVVIFTCRRDTNGFCHLSSSIVMSTSVLRVARVSQTQMQNRSTADELAMIW